MINKCEICKNKKICKYKEEYNKILNKVTDTYPLTDIKDTFDLELNCLYYEKEKQLSTQEMEQILNRNYIKSSIALDNITLTGKPTWCDCAYPCSECEKVSYCADRYLAKKEKANEIK